MLKRRIYFSLFLCIVMGGVVTDAVNKEENVFCARIKSTKQIACPSPIRM